MSETETKRPDIIYRNGKPSAVILELKEYEELLEQIEDVEDLAYLEELRRKPIQFVSLDNLLKERSVGV
ncbi:MAG: type II toxin-antitoxin system Phd/YefM family antitoxin [Calditrichota bacterium]